jgi:prepilin-type N-terminal cleavage/methylation domain-containing protein
MKAGMSTLKRNSGFTATELLVTLFIMGILASIAIPAFSGWSPNYKLKAAAREMVSVLQLAKSTAIKEHSDAVVWFDTAENKYRVFSDDGEGGGTEGDGVQNGTEETIKEVTLPVGIDMYDTLFSVKVNQTSFNNRSVAEGGWGYAYLKNNNSQYMRLTVWTTGYLQIESSTDGANWS